MALGDITAEEIMVPRNKLLTVTVDEKIAAADILMVRNGIGSLLILDDQDKLIGIITDGDIIKVRNSTDIPHKTVDHVMTRNPITIPPNTSLKKILSILIKHNIDHLPVVDKGEIKGIVSQTRILRVILKSLTE
ncbi:MAG: CBS domain-containing protein [Candidatus Lokiarchaeota archaeon]|nr:CBS domain-containing protein [Candidatus Lokiarchaeota archaeon]